MSYSVSHISVQQQPLWLGLSVCGGLDRVQPVSQRFYREDSLEHGQPFSEVFDG
jgi:hypothetical protein